MILPHSFTDSAGNSKDILGTPACVPGSWMDPTPDWPVSRNPPPDLMLNKDCEQLHIDLLLAHFSILYIEHCFMSQKWTMVIFLMVFLILWTVQNEINADTFLHKINTQMQIKNFEKYVTTLFTQWNYFRLSVQWWGSEQSQI